MLADIGCLFIALTIACHLNGLAYVLGVIRVFKWVRSHKHDVKSHPTGPDICKLHEKLSLPSMTIAE